MKVKILKPFRDIHDYARHYDVGTFAEFPDSARVAGLVASGLVELCNCAPSVASPTETTEKRRKPVKPVDEQPADDQP